MSYACARRGWTLITDEVSSLVRGSGGRAVLGNPRYLHFRETAAAVFPELNSSLAAPNSVGKVSIEVSAAAKSLQTAFQASVAAVVFLDRQSAQPARLMPLSSADAFLRFVNDLPLFPQPQYDAHLTALRELVQNGAFELRYHEFDEALALLETLANS